MALSWTLDKLGPFARSAEDCGLILQVIAGKDSKDPGSAGKSFYYTPQYARAMKDLKVGYAPVDFTDRADPSARAAFAAALEVIKQTGVQLVEPKWPPFPYGAVLSTILAAEEASIFESLIVSGKVDELADKPQIAGLKAAMDVSAKDYLKAMRIRRLIQEEFSKLFAEVDVLIAPGRPGPAIKADQRLDAPTSPPPPAGRRRDSRASSRRGISQDFPRWCCRAARR
jgi:aspartyl-tRNA(Asn)/glutamyl-tRNA(Gln) amidotransferase subunit A